MNSSSVFGHEIAEQFEKQVNGISDLNIAHNKIIQIEDAISGASRINIGTAAGTSRVNESGTGHYDINHQVNNSIITVKINIVNWNVTGVSR